MTHLSFFLSLTSDTIIRFAKLNVDQMQWKSPKFVTLCPTWPASASSFSRAYRRASPLRWVASSLFLFFTSPALHTRVCCTWNWIKKINQEKTGSSNTAVTLLRLKFLTSLFLPFFSLYFMRVNCVTCIDLITLQHLDFSLSLSLPLAVGTNSSWHSSNKS